MLDGMGKSEKDPWNRVLSGTDQRQVEWAENLKVQAKEMKGWVWLGHGRGLWARKVDNQYSVQGGEYAALNGLRQLD